MTTCDLPTKSVLKAVKYLTVEDVEAFALEAILSVNKNEIVKLGVKNYYNGDVSDSGTV